jgi:hypothetical protein
MPGPATSALQRLQKRLAKLDSERAEVVRAIEALRPAAELELTGSKQTANIGAMRKRTTAQAAKIKHARGMSDDALVTVASDAQLTLRDLAKTVGCSGPLLTLARKGLRSISMELATKIQEATRSPKHPDGFDATKANWPTLRG